MPYTFATEDQDFSDYASGRVIYNLPGLPAFPVRMASEMFQRAAAHLPTRRLALYDPCCGGAYHLAALGFLHGARIASILASDVDNRALELAQRNLALLTPQGLARREGEIRQMLAAYGKGSHAEALQSLSTLRKQQAANGLVPSRVFQANALAPEALRHGVAGEAIDLVLSDIPYGLMTGWQLPETGRELDQSPAWRFLEALQAVLQPGVLVAIAADKGQKIAHPGYRRLDRFQIGKRQAVILSY